MSKPLTAQTLAQLLHEELSRDGWGDIDPDHFESIARSLPDSELGEPEHVESLRQVLQRVADRLNQQLAAAIGLQAAAKAKPGPVSPEVAFISGHLNLTDEEFSLYYKNRILQAAQVGARFVVGDARGTDLMAQQLLRDIGCRAVTVYHMHQSPRHNAGSFSAIGGFLSDEDRDHAMTQDSTCDIAWVRPGRESSGTARNLARRAR